MVNFKRTGLALAILFLAQLFFFSPTTHAMSLKSCDYAYTDSTYKKISQSCGGGLIKDGTFNYKSASGTTAVYTLTTSISGGNTLNTKCTTTIAVNKNVLKSGKISGTTPFGNFCDTVASENIVIDLAQSNASIQTDAGNKVLHDKLDSLISSSCSSLGSADAISSCVTRGKAAIDTCGPAALNAANQASTVGGAGTDPSAVYLANLLPCLNNATGIQQSQLAKALGGNIYAEVSDASNNAKVVEDCVIDPNTGKCESEDKDKTSCNIDNIGWIICPVMNFMAGIVDAAYDWIADLLTVQPIVTTGTGTNLYQAWQIMRNFANVMFVLGFLIIIYSQITGMGVSNYGIKKLLPKLIVAAILVNVSYWVCSIAVDLSNIAGTGLNSLFENLKGTIGAPELKDGAFDENSGTGWAGITGLVLAGVVTGGVVALAGVSILLPALIAALIAIVTVFLVLTLRQALIILLIVISPLAFVALLLPNTEEWFKKWRSLFQTLLLMFPIISVIFGASAFAAEIVMKTSTTFAVQIMGALITILPLAITPIVMKTAGGVLNRFAGYINNPNKGPFDRMRKGAERVREDQEGKRAIRAMNGGRVFGRSRFQRRAKRDAISQGIKSESGRATSQYIADEIGGNEDFRNRVAGGSRGTYSPNATGEAMQRALASATLTIDKAVAEDIQAESVIVRNMDGSALKGILANNSSSDAQKSAAMQRLVKIGDPGGPDGYADEINKAMTSGSDTLRRATAEALGKDGPGFMKASDIDKIATGSHRKADGSQSTLQSIAQDNVKAGVYSQEKLVDDTSGNLQFAFDSADQDGKQRMVNTAAELKANPNLSGKIKHNAESIDNLSQAQRP